MGAAESTTRTNGTREEEDERQRAASGSSTAAEAAVGATMALAAVGAAAWGISRMVSQNTEKDDEMKMKGTVMEASSYALQNSSPYGLVRYGMSAPPQGPFKMNTDASCRQNEDAYDHSVKRGPSGFAGVLRDHRGQWVRAFHGYIGVTDCLTAEISGIYHGLRLLDKMGLKEATLESDCTAAIDWVKQVNNSNNSRRSPIINKNWEMISNCRDLIVKNKITVSYCTRESNKVADKLADMAIEKRDRYKEITEIPGEIKRIVDQESSFW